MTLVTKIRLGIVGCGYVTQYSHLPASQLVAGVEVVALVDLNQALAQELADTYQIPLVTADYWDLAGQVEAAIVAVPHQFHAPITIALLQMGIHVLCEKPMALTSAACRQMIAAAETADKVLAIGHMRRFYDNMRLVKQLLATGALGNGVQFYVEEAVSFANFAAGAFAVQPPSGGVLWDTGPHPLDLLLWWFGAFTEVGYQDDGRGGVEANCQLAIVTESGATGEVVLSRTRGLANKIVIWGSELRLTIPTHSATKIEIEAVGLSTPLVTAPSGEGQRLPFYYGRQLRDFCEAIQGKGAPAVTGADGVGVIEVIERCRQARVALARLPWEVCYVEGGEAV